MPRLVGVDIPNEKQIWISLRYIYGIGPAGAKRILEAVNIPFERKAKDLTDEDLSKITTEIEKSFVVEGQLRRQRLQNLNRLKDINCVRGIRHKRSLPVRGQRTKTNARTRKGPRRIVAQKKREKRK